jgi:hypothetical protein
MASSAIGAPPSARRRRDAARLLLAWALLVAVVLLVGAALTGPLAGSVGVADNDFERSLVGHRSTGLSAAAQGASLLGETTTQLALVPMLLLVVWWWLRRARPVVFLAVVAVGEIAAYLLTVSVVSRPRPPVRCSTPASSRCTATRPATSRPRWRRTAGWPCCAGRSGPGPGGG